MDGIFISFEGGEGAGKTTQITRLQAWFEAKGREVVLTREPGGTPAAEAVRELFVSGDTDRWDGMSEALLVFAGRRNHVLKLIKPALERGAVVLCDRYVDSSMAYQGYGREIGPDIINWLAGHCIDGVMPDITFLLDLPVDEGLARAGGRDGANAARFERAGLDFHERMRAAYLDIARNNPERVSVIDAAQDIESIAASILSTVIDKLADRI